MKIISCFLLAVSLVSAQVALTDADLLVAFDRAETELTTGVDVSTLTIPVASGAVFPLSSGQATLITIDYEQMKICSRSGNTLTVCAGGRGFGGTLAAAHISRSKVSGRVSAYYHNRMKDAVKALDGFRITDEASIASINSSVSSLGTRVSTAESSLTALPAAIAGAGNIISKYQWSQQPGGSLVAGANVVTLAPVPTGLNGTDAFHYLWVSGGTGTAEACLIIGGTAVSGGASGTVIMTCTYTHSGSWTVASDTGGVYEAINALPATGGEVIIPENTTIDIGSIDGLIITKNNVVISGRGWSSSFRARANARIHQVLWARGDGFVLRDIKIDGNRSNNGTYQSVGIIQQGSQSLFDHVEITATDYIGISYQSAVDGQGSYSDLVYCNVHDNGSVGQGLGFGIHGYTSNNAFRPSHIRVDHTNMVKNYNLVANTTGYTYMGAGLWADIAHLTISNSSVRDNHNHGGQIGDAATVGTDRYWNITDTAVEMTETPLALTSGIEFNGNYLNVTGAYLKGLYAGIAIQPQGTTTVGYFRISNNHFSQMTYAGIWLIQAGSNPADGFTRVGIIANNTFISCPIGVDNAARTSYVTVRGNTFQDGVTTPVTNYTGLMDVGANIPLSVNQASLFMLASASTVALPVNSSDSVYYMSGTAAVATISGGYQGMVIRVIPQAVWTTTTAGNIGKASTAVVGQVMTLIYDGTKWWPSY